MNVAATLIPVAEAQRRLFALAGRVSPETVPLVRALNHWAAADLTARRTQPASDLSAMDGYAIRFADLPGPFRLIGESAAGRPFAGSLATGETVRIFTGAALPDGADTVMIQEDVTRDDRQIMLSGTGPSARGSSVRRRGLDFSSDDVLIARGDRVTPARIAIAATGGHAAITVNRPIRVAVVATGDELVAPGAAIGASSLPESNGVMLAAMLADLPVEVIDLGILPDHLESMTAAFARVDADILVTTGGASVGDHDLVRPALLAAGGEIDFWRVAVRPGKPMLAGRLGGAIILGLPGNPVSAFVTATVFLRPLLAAMAGARDPLPRLTAMTLGAALPANDQRQDYLRATISDGAVFLSGLQDSSMLAILAGADCLIVRAPYAPAAAAGDQVMTLLIA